ncbi:MAG: hypothetical protein H7125_10280 [Proteobacteria bacterium]|nr:hypothetical protein [Burkholderiales bacterium]
MSWLEWFEFGSYLVTIIGLPLAILIFVAEHRKSIRAEDAEIYQRLSDDYGNFLELAIQNSDLGLLRRDTVDDYLNDDQRERAQAMFRILTALFERAYILLYDKALSAQRRRQWATWDDYMREWCQRDDYRRALPELLEGEDAAFVAHIRGIIENLRTVPDTALPAIDPSIRAATETAPDFR